jgi:uncharacterized membrane protein
MSQTGSEDRAFGRVAYWGFGLFGSAVLAFADALVRAGSIEYSNGQMDAPIHVAAFGAVMVLALCGFLGVFLARVQRRVAVWLLRVAAAGSIVASLNAMIQSHPIVGLGLLFFSGLPLMLAAWSVGWAER